MTLGIHLNTSEECNRYLLLNIQERLLGMDSEILKDLLVHSDFDNLTCHQHKEIFGNQSHYWGCRPEDPEFYDCHPEILWKDINVSQFVNIPTFINPPKDQLISKCLFLCLQILPKKEQ